MSRTHQVTGQIVDLERRRNTMNGNPRWKVTLDSGLVLRTGDDSTLGDSITNSEWAGRPLLFFVEDDVIVRMTPAPQPLPSAKAERNLAS